MLLLLLLLLLGGRTTTTLLVCTTTMVVETGAGRAATLDTFAGGVADDSFTSTHEEGVASAPAKRARAVVCRRLVRGSHVGFDQPVQRTNTSTMPCGDTR